MQEQPQTKPRKTYLPLRKQQEGVKFVLTKRDMEIVRCVNRYRYLTASLLKRLILQFRKNESFYSIHLRLKVLFHNQYLQRLTPYNEEGHQSEFIYYLDSKGRELLEDREEEVFFYNKAGEIKHVFIDHTLALSTFRVALEIALESHPLAMLQDFIPDFEVKSQCLKKKASDQTRYKVYQEVKDPKSGNKVVILPDSIIVVQGQGDFANHQMCYCLEIDRGTESLRIIAEKMKNYWLYSQKPNPFNEFGLFGQFIVLLQTESEQRAKNIHKYLAEQNTPGRELLLVTSKEKVTEESIVKDHIWFNSKGELKALIPLP